METPYIADIDKKIEATARIAIQWYEASLRRQLTQAETDRIYMDARECVIRNETREERPRRSVVQRLRDFFNNQKR